MPGVFLSHSSIDKEIVVRLAIDLVNRSFPVWLDSWQMGLGDQLYDHIYEGIDSSSFLILILSQQSVQSQWVNDEINGALAKERDVNRTFLIPVKIDDCDVPLKIRGRIHADFSRSYLEGLELLSAHLRKVGLDQQTIPVEQELLPLEITRGTLLNRPALEARLESMRKRATGKLRIKAVQIVLSPDPTYKTLKTKLLNTLERSRTSSEFTIEGQHYILTAYRGVQELEQAIPGSIADVVNRFSGVGTDYHVAEACFWLIRIFRNELFSLMYSAQRGDDPPILPVPDTCIINISSGPEYWARFFEVAHPAHFTVFRKDKEETCGVWIDGDYSWAKELEEYQSYDHRLFLKALPREVIFKFIIPQIVFRRDFSDDWDIENCLIRND